MSRSGYSEECDGWDLIRWRGAVASAIRGEYGQSFLRAALVALDEMPEKRLVTSALVTPEGECCTMGAVALRYGRNTKSVDPFERDEVAELFGIAPALAAEIAYENDEHSTTWKMVNGRHTLVNETDEERWTRMRAWVASQIKEPNT